MIALSSSYELATTYLQVYLLWMFCSELVLSFACVYFVITDHLLPVWDLSILRANLASTEKSAAGKVGLTLPRYRLWHASLAYETIIWQCFVDDHMNEVSLQGYDYSWNDLWQFRAKNNYAKLHAKFWLILQIAAIVLTMI